VAKYGFTIVTLRKLQLEIGNCIALYLGYKRKTVGLLNRKVGVQQLFLFRLNLNFRYLRSGATQSRWSSRRRAIASRGRTTLTRSGAEQILAIVEAEKDI